ncbi:MAG: hypothetical protein JXR77_07830 [Lentisphaeria bacterium]|nr:hypothetical protein [Lentisphaeria bacterium]
MSVRAVVLGLLGAAFICGYTYFNDGVLRQTMFVGNHMPASVYGGLLLFLFLVNPLLRRVHGRWLCGCGGGFRFLARVLRPFSARELTVVVALSLPACCVPYSSMLRILPKEAMLPHHYVKTETGWSWKDADGATRTVLEYAPRRMLADGSHDDGEAVVGFVQGIRLGSEPIRVRDVPWAAWRETLAFWLPLFGILWIALTGIALVFHRQWSDHEHLPYPLVQFTQALLPTESGAISPVFRCRSFWIGMTLVLVVHLNNVLCVYYPESLIEIRRVFPFWPLARLFPTFMRGGGWSLINPRFYFAAVGIAYFLASDVSLAVGLGPFVFTYVGGLLAGYGIPMGAGTRFTPRIDQSLVFGGYIGFFCAMLYTGRHFYRNVLRRALGMRCSEWVGASSVWGMRVFVAAFAVFILDLALLGLDWQLAVVYALLTLIIFVVMGRIIAETGLFFIAPYLYPCVFIFGFLGEQALGPKALMIMFVLTCMLLIDPRETFMPYMVNTVKLLDENRLRLGRTATLSLLAVFLGLAVAVPMTLYFAYDRGVNWEDWFGTKGVPMWAPEGAVKARQRLLAQDQLEHSLEIRGWARFLEAKPHTQSTVAFCIALAGVILFVGARLRFARWPLHPVMFLTWPGYAGYMMAWSFLGGCFLKTMVTRYGGSHSYQRLKPLMFGLIAGDVLASLLTIIIGLFYNLHTGSLPKTYWVLPG